MAAAAYFGACAAIFAGGIGARVALLRAFHVGRGR
jgi:hypothetical protein